MAAKQHPTKRDLVHITDDNSPPLSWTLGIVHETYTGNDNLVRVAIIKTGKGKFSDHSKTQEDTNQQKLTSIQKLWKMVLQK